MRNSGVQFSGCAEREAPRPAGLPVAMAKGIHLFPYRTQKLSPCAPMVLGWRRPGRVGRCRIPMRKRPDVRLGAFVYARSPLHSRYTVGEAIRRVEDHSPDGSPEACTGGERCAFHLHDGTALASAGFDPGLVSR